jgi:hypothetical protein
MIAKAWFFWLPAAAAGLSLFGGALLGSAHLLILSAILALLAFIGWAVSRGAEQERGAKD